MTESHVYHRDPDNDDRYCICGHPEIAWVHPHTVRRAKDGDGCACGLPVDAKCHVRFTPEQSSGFVLDEGVLGERNAPMSQEAMLPCLKCGKSLPNAISGVDNQPYGGTVFRTEGHYGSTFWDSFDGEELIINVCDDCLRENRDRLGQQKIYLPVVAGRVGMVGRQWVDRPMVHYTGSRDDGNIKIEPEEIGVDSAIEWAPKVNEIREFAIALENGDAGL